MRLRRFSWRLKFANVVFDFRRESEKFSFVRSHLAAECATKALFHIFGKRCAAAQNLKRCHIEKLRCPIGRPWLLAR